MTATPEMPRGNKHGEQSPHDHDEVGTLSVALARYQAGETDPWTAVILQAVEGRIRRLASRLPVVPGSIDREDLEQQLRVEILVAAKTLRLDAELWIPRMLLERAARGTRRWATRQSRVIGIPLSEGIEALPEVGLCERVPFMAAVNMAGISVDAAELLFRHHVLGESFAAIATTSGTTTSALKSRTSRAAVRIRKYRDSSTGGQDAATMPDINTDEG